MTQLLNTQNTLIKLDSIQLQYKDTIKLNCCKTTLIYM
jgi:hypothetical protein